MRVNKESELPPISDLIQSNSTELKWMATCFCFVRFLLFLVSCYSFLSVYNKENHIKGGTQIINTKFFLICIFLEKFFESMRVNKESELPSILDLIQSNSTELKWMATCFCFVRFLLFLVSCYSFFERI